MNWNKGGREEEGGKRGGNTKGRKGWILLTVRKSWDRYRGLSSRLFSLSFGALR